MTRCENCGCILEAGICSNCHEELFIMTFQGEHMQYPISDEFQDRAAEQSREISTRRNGGGTV